VLGLAALLVLAGIWLDRTVLRSFVQRIEYEVVAVPFPDVVKVEKKVGVPVPGPRDTLWLPQSTDSLQAIIFDKMRPDTVAFADTLEYVDSLARFSAVELTTIKHDPWIRIYERTWKIQNALLEYTKVTMHDTELIVSPIWSAIAFVAGFLLALLLA
jgi:hypothetical protein